MEKISKILIGLTLLSTGCSSKKEQKQVKSPNILFILSDDHTSQAWGVYGGILSKYAKNENIKKLAQEGCVLDQCFCTNSLSAPSRATILTGKYSNRNGVYTLSESFNPQQNQLPKQLQKGGYQTALFGKWHLKSKPQGYDTFEVFNDQGEYINPIFKTKSNWVPNKNIGDTVKGFSTDIVADKTIAYIKHRQKDQPFFISCHFKATHEPWDFPARNKDLYKGVTFPHPKDMMTFDTKKSHRTFSGQPLENLALRWETASKAPEKWWCKYPELPFGRKGISDEADREQIYQKMVRDYLRCGATIDQNIGRLLQCLKEEGLDENTIVIYVADQGYFLGEHGFFDKRMMLEEALRMPFVIRYPKEIPAKTRNKDMILNIDFASTLADYAGVKAPEGAQGESFRSNLEGNTPKDWRKSMYYHYWIQEKKRPAHIGIRNEHYKLMFLYGLPLQQNNKDVVSAPSWEFYDLKNDPKEYVNQFDNSKYKSIIKTMKKEMMQLRQKYGESNEQYPELEELLKKNL